MARSMKRAAKAKNPLRRSLQTPGPRGQEGLIAHLNRIQNMDVLAGMLLRDFDDRPQLECAARIPAPARESMAEPWTFRSSRLAPDRLRSCLHVTIQPHSGF
jgi:hypothetical protein